MGTEGVSVPARVPPALVIRSMGGAFVATIRQDRTGRHCLAGFAASGKGKPTASTLTLWWLEIGADCRGGGRVRDRRIQLLPPAISAKALHIATRSWLCNQAHKLDQLRKKLPKKAKNAGNCGNLRKIAETCGKLRELAKNCGKLREIAGTCENCEKLREIAGTCENLRTFAGNCGDLRKIAPKYQQPNAGLPMALSAFH